MKSEMSRKSDMFHPYTLVIHPDFKELGDFILSLPERFEKNEGIVIHNSIKPKDRDVYALLFNGIEKDGIWRSGVCC